MLPCGPSAQALCHASRQRQAPTLKSKNDLSARVSRFTHLSYIGEHYHGLRRLYWRGFSRCNYDGYHKFKTHIGNSVFVGSDTMMVAPVSIGDGARGETGSCTKVYQQMLRERSEQKIVEIRRPEASQAKKRTRCSRTQVIRYWLLETSALHRYKRPELSS